MYLITDEEREHLIDVLSSTYRPSFHEKDIRLLVSLEKRNPALRIK